MHTSASLCFRACNEILLAQGMHYCCCGLGLIVATATLPAVRPDLAGRVELELGSGQGSQRTTCSRGRGACWTAVEGPHRL